jgi:hypothetical protein
VNVKNSITVKIGQDPQPWNLSKSKIFSLGHGQKKTNVGALQ